MSEQAVVYHLDIGEEEEDSDDEANEDHHTRLGQDFLQTGRQVEDWKYKALVQYSNLWHFGMDPDSRIRTSD